MKKVFFIALSSLMIVAFTQCGESGSQEFKDSKALLEKKEKAINKATTCDELQSSLLLITLSALAEQKEYAENEEMTDKEKIKIEELSKRIDDLIEKKNEELGCSDEDLNYNSSMDLFQEDPRLNFEELNIRELEIEELEFVDDVNPEDYDLEE